MCSHRETLANIVGILSTAIAGGQSDGSISNASSPTILACQLWSGTVGALLGMTAGGNSFTILLGAAFLIGGTSNPLYSLLLAYTNDFIEQEDMASVSGGLVFINGLGAISGPILTGWMMSSFGPSGYFLLLAVLLAAMAAYAGFRMTQRAAPAVEDSSNYAPVWMSSSQMSVEYALETGAEDAESTETT